MTEDGKQGGNGREQTVGGSSAAGGGMHTMLREFCEGFDRRVRPLTGPLGKLGEALEQAPPAMAAKRALPGIREVAHQFAALVDKVAQQQAYVLIFGPLKSGKSTFMNALCATYVSEVTCLPAYPAMVYVSHAPSPSFIVHQYDGQQREYAQGEQLHEAVAEAHRDLTAAMRQVEARGGTFDPATDMPGAIRRIDVKVPAGDLAQSGAVLVDTPGLYSRMKFGYDRMTREFRDAAACAIFIVKTDNLFLEQVFAEFQQLLDLFSRIFLVVNLDSSKTDLMPDGTVAPSLEHVNPQKVIEAFRDLSMTAPLAKAAEEGRLRIYPVDLLNAAGRRIRAGRNGQVESPPAEESAANPQADFDALLADLTDYLNSNEYLRAFMGDSLRRAATLLNELGAAMRHEGLGELSDELYSLRKQYGESEAALASAQRVREMDLTSCFEPIGQALRQAVQAAVQQERQQTGHALSGAIGGWFNTHASLQSLIGGELQPLLAGARRRCVEAASKALVEQVAREHGGLLVGETMLRDLKRAKVDLTAAATSTINSETPVAALPEPDASLATERIPVRKGFWDWVLFRRRAAVRRRLLGPDGNPDKPVTPLMKGRRLGEPAGTVLREHAAAQLEALLRRAGQSYPAAVHEAHRQAVGEALHAALDARMAELKTTMADLQQRIEQAERIIRALEAVRKNADETRQAVTTLGRQFTPQVALEPQVQIVIEPMGVSKPASPVS